MRVNSNATTSISLIHAIQLSLFDFETILITFNIKSNRLTDLFRFQYHVKVTQNIKGTPKYQGQPLQFTTCGLWQK